MQPFLRAAEQLVLEVKLAPVLTYWSAHHAAKWLPDGKTFRELLGNSLCLSIFSEDRDDSPDEWGFWMETCELCLVVYGQQNTGGSKIIEGDYPPSFDGDQPHSVGFPRRPLPFSGDTDIALPEPGGDNQEIE